MTKPEGPAQEPQCCIGGEWDGHTLDCYAAHQVPQKPIATPAPSQPAGAREWLRQEPCPECDGDGCAACLADVEEWFRVNRPKLHDAVKYAAGEKGKAFDIIVFEACAAYAAERIATLTDKLCRMQDDIATIVSTHRTDWSWNDVVADVKILAQQTAAKDAEIAELRQSFEVEAERRFQYFCEHRMRAAERERDSLRAENAALKAAKDGQQ